MDRRQIATELETQELFGLNFVDSDSASEVADVVIDLATDSYSATVVTPNVDIMVLLQDEPDGEAADAISSAEICTPDGQPIVWASKLAGKPLTSRLAGSTIFAELWPAVKEAELPVTMIASKSEVKDFFEADYDKVEVIQPGVIDLDDEVGFDEFLTETIKLAVSNNSRIVFSGIGYPKDPVIAQRLRKAWPRYSSEPAPIVMCLGASYEMYSGLQSRAPEWMQNSGLEWLHRFVQEPKRLFGRYFIRGPRFLKSVASELFSK